MKNFFYLFSLLLLPGFIYTQHTSLGCGAEPGAKTILTLSAFNAALTIKSSNYAHIEWRYPAQGDSAWKSNITSTNNLFSISGLTSGNTYEVQVRKLCTGETIWTNWSESVHFNTSSCQLPYEGFLLSKTFSNDSANSPCQKISKDDLEVVQFLKKHVELKVKNIEVQGNIIWRYRKLGEDEVWLYLTSTEESPHVFDLPEIGVEYEVQVQQFCENLNAWSDWSDSKVFSLEDCALPISEKVVIRTNFEQFPNLNARIVCADDSRQADWSETVEFTTTICLIPIEGDLALVEYYGLYFVRVLVGQQTFTERILLQKP